MKKGFVIFLLFAFLSANTAFGEVLKLPLLIHHYIEHSQEDNDISVIDFLAKHYGKGINHTHTSNHNDHDNLPFKSINSHSVQIIYFQPFCIEFSIRIVEKELKTPILQQQIYANTFLNSIWQPPQIS